MNEKYVDAWSTNPTFLVLSLQLLAVLHCFLLNWFELLSKSSVGPLMPSKGDILLGEIYFLDIKRFSFCSNGRRLYSIEMNTR